MRKYDPNGKAQLILTLLASGPADMDAVYAEAAVQRRPNIRKKFFHVVLSLVEDQLAARHPTETAKFSITPRGVDALQRLLIGEAVVIDEAIPGLRHRSRAA